MSRVSLSDFKDHKFFIVLTALLSVLSVAILFLEPSYSASFGESFAVSVVGHITVLPLFVWWFYNFWNILLVKLFKLQRISYGVAFLIMMSITVIFG